MREGSPGWLTTVAADYAARGEIDDALVRAATAAQVGLATINDDGRIWWSDETYRLHGRPRWRRVRTIDDLAWGLTDGAALRAAYIATLENPDVDLRFTAIGEAGETRELVLLALGRGVVVVHRAAARTASEPPTPDDRSTPAAAEAPHAEAAVHAADVAPEGDDEAADDDARWDLAAAVLSATPDLLVLYDLDSGSAVSLAGSAEVAPELVEHLRGGGNLREHFHPDDLEALGRWRRDFEGLGDGEVRHLDARFLVGGDWRWRELRVSEFRRDDDGHVLEVVIIVRDVDERVTSTLRIAESERAFREVFDASPIGLAVLDDSGRFTDVNDAFCRLVGRTREAVLATVYEALLHPQDRAAAVITRARRISEGTKQSSTDARLVRADGGTVWVRVRSSDIDHHEGPRTLVSIEDVTHAKATEEQLRHDALHDELTGLPNRRLLLDRLERAILRSRRSGNRLAVYFIDLDDLKRVNDTHPWKHRAGDVLLTTTAEAVRGALRDADTLGRLGGDEFVAICEDMSEESVDDIGVRILQAATAAQTIGGETIHPGASVGVALALDDDEDGESLLRRADAAMYRAKRDGGSRVVRADSSGHPIAPPVDLAGAIERRELVQHYLPIVSLATGAVLGVTTVVRRLDGLEPVVGTDPDLGTRSLPVVQWALAQAIADVRTVAPTRVEHVSVWVPTSARAALATSTRDCLSAALRGMDGREGGDSAPSLVLDVAESEVGMLTRRQAMAHHLDQLLDLGPLALGVAHFTADSVPLGVLQQLSAASVSLDPALIDEATEKQATAEVVHALVAAASALGVVTIAMGITSHEQLATARELGVHAVYGDLIGPAAPLDTYSDLLHGGRITLPTPVSLAAESTEDASDGGGEAAENVADLTDEAPRGRGPVDEWAQLMAARLAEPAAEKPHAAGSGTEPSSSPAASSSAAAPTPAPSVSPSAPAHPTLRVPMPAAPAAAAPAEALDPATPQVDHGAADISVVAETPAPLVIETALPTPAAEPVQAAAPSVETIPTPPSLAVPAMPTIPAMPSVPAMQAIPAMPSVPGDIGGDLARELGISWPLDPLPPGAFATVTDSDSPHWRALTSESPYPGENRPTQS